MLVYCKINEFFSVVVVAYDNKYAKQLIVLAIQGVK